jgi:hypothetical protein
MATKRTKLDQANVDFIFNLDIWINKETERKLALRKNYTERQRQWHAITEYLIALQKVQTLIHKHWNV